MQLKWLNIYDRHKKFIASDIFKFYNNQCSNYFDIFFCPVGDNSVITHSFNKTLKPPFRKAKLGIQSLSYLGPKTWNSFPDNMKSATSVNSYKHIKEYFLKTFGDIEAGIYGYT